MNMSTYRGKSAFRGGRSGRGRGSRSSTPKQANRTKTITDYNYYVGSVQQASDYNITTEFIINYIKKTYDQGNNIGTALKDLIPMDENKNKPDLKASTLKDTILKSTQVEQYKMKIRVDYDEFRKIIRTYTGNMTKSYALIWERCTKGMQNKIQTRTDFETNIENDPIELLKAVKEHALNYQEHRYAMSIVLDSFMTMMPTKQKYHESLSNYTKKFKVAKDVMESHIGGPII